MRKSIKVTVIALTAVILTGLFKKSHKNRG